MLSNENVHIGTIIFDNLDNEHIVDARQFLDDNIIHIRTVHDEKSYVWNQQGVFLSGPLSNNLKLVKIATKEENPEYFL